MKCCSVPLHHSLKLLGEGTITDERTDRWADSLD